MAYRNQPSSYGCNNNSMQRGTGVRNAGVTNASCNTMGNSSTCDSIAEVCHDTVKKDQLYGMPLAMAYVPWQQFENLYCAKDAMEHGTLFMDLDLDFYGRRCN